MMSITLCTRYVSIYAVDLLYSSLKRSTGPCKAFSSFSSNRSNSMQKKMKCLKQVFKCPAASTFSMAWKCICCVIMSVSFIQHVKTFHRWINSRRWLQKLGKVSWRCFVRRPPKSSRGMLQTPAQGISPLHLVVSTCISIASHVHYIPLLIWSSTHVMT